MSTQLSEVTACVGETVTYTCTARSSVHVWTVGTVSALVTSLTGGNILRPPFTFRLLITGTNIVSSMTVTVFGGLNNTSIVCRGSGSGDVQETTTRVLGEVT